MCGIAGIYHFDHTPVHHRQLKAMTDVIAHRGPDGEGQYIDKNLGLGHRRLAIIDLSPAGHQPMQTRDQRYTITYNGEIYNFHALRIELEARGYQFHSNTDTEVFLNAFAEWNIDCLNRLNGMFACAIWDKVEKKLLLMRDRYGIKPLYYLANDQHVIFASEIKAIVASDCYTPSLDKAGLLEYLTFQNFFTDKTLFENIQLLKPGHLIEFNACGQRESIQYWDFNFSNTIKISRQEAIEETDRLFTQAVNRQLISDVPVNAYLSGGIDSASITMIAKKSLPNLKNFTIGFDLNSVSGIELSFDERVNAEKISYMAQTEHYQMVLKSGDIERCMNQYVKHLEEPRVGQSYPNFYAAKLASKFGKVVLAGTGGDELFGGYPWRYFRPEKPIVFNDMIDQYYLKWQRLVNNSTLKQLIKPIWKDVEHIRTRDIFEQVFRQTTHRELSEEDCFEHSLYLEAKTFLHGLLVVEDKLSMAHSIETRVPFLDNDLVDFACQLPMSLKVGRNDHTVNENNIAEKFKHSYQGKKILRETFKKYLGDSFVKNKKQGFSSPDATWFKGESIDYIESEFNHLPPEINSNIARLILSEHKSGEKNNRLIIWSLLYLTKLQSQYR